MPFDPRDLVAALGSLGSLRGSPAGAAFAQTWQQLEQQKRQREQQETEQRMRQNQMGLQEMQAQASMQNITADNQRAEREQRMRFVQSLPEFLGDETIETPDAFEQRFGVASRLGSEIGVEPGFLQTFRPAPDKFVQRKAKKVVARIEGDKRFAQHLANPEFAAQMFQEGEETKSYAEWKTLAGQGGPTAGSPPLPTQPQRGVGTDYAQALERYAKERGKTADTLTSAEELAFKRRFSDAGLSQVSIFNAQEAQEIAAGVADAIIRGEQPPTLTGMRQYTAIVRGELAKRGYDLTAATQDWNAMSRHLATLNSVTQLRLRQAIESSLGNMDQVEAAIKEWQAGQFPLLNRARMAAAKQGAFGTKAQVIATRLEALIADAQADLSVVYRGGLSPTDETIEQARQALQSDWSDAQLKALARVLRRQLLIRKNAIETAGSQGTPGNIYERPGALIDIETGKPGVAPNTAPPRVRTTGPPVTSVTPSAGPQEGDEAPIPPTPGVRGGIAVYRGGRWRRKTIE